MVNEQVDVTDEMKELMMARPEEFAKNWREALNISVKLLKDYKESLSSIPVNEWEDRGEVFANLMLALRHIEDARMRLWKMIQYSDGWVSVYDKK